MLSASELSVGYRSKTLLRSARFELERGEIVGLIAPNGHGKTTLMTALAGRRRPVLGGGALADGRPVCAEAGSTSSVLYIPGDASMLHRQISARDHLRIARAAWRSELDVDEVVEELAMGSFSRMPTRRLSQGMKQLVSLAIGRIAEAPYLLLDEPSNALDPGKSALLATVLRRIAERGRGVLVSSHNLRQLAGLCDRLLFIKDQSLRDPGPDIDRDACELLFEEYYGEEGCAETG